MTAVSTFTAGARRLLRGSVVAGLCAVLLLAGGCSALRVGYNQADWLAFRWLDNYADFDDEQEKRVRDAIATWFAWHRKTQLADYATLLLRIDSEVPADISPERVCGLWSEVRTRIDRSAQHAVPALADLAHALRPVQIENIENRYVKSNAKFVDEHMQKDLAKRANASAKRVVERAESFYGDLDPYLSERVERWASESPYDPSVAFDERRRRQLDALQILRGITAQPVDKAAAQAQIKGWIQRINRSPRETHRLHAERVVQYNCQLAAALHNATSAAQRQVASKRLRGWAADLRALSAQVAD